ATRRPQIHGVVRGFRADGDSDLALSRDHQTAVKTTRSPLELVSSPPSTLLVIALPAKWRRDATIFAERAVPSSVVISRINSKGKRSRAIPQQSTRPAKPSSRRHEPKSASGPR